MIGTADGPHESGFEKNLRALLNEHCKENDSNTPDFLLARYLMRSLETYNDIVRDRDQWLGYRRDTWATLTELP